MDDRGVTILFEDECCLVALKPAGAPTQAPSQFDSLELRVRQLLADRAAAGAQGYLGLPHRLDRAVSGAILFAKTRRAARVISRQFERREVQKIYWACVEGAVSPEQGTWIDFVRKLPGQAQAEVVTATDAQAQQAILHYRLLGSSRLGSWLEINLETGRMHQVRIQAASREHPLAGDTLYGAASLFGPTTDDPRQRAIALHARSLTFTHPETNERLCVTAPVGPSWRELGISEPAPGT